jgi:hypothetical protein
MGRLAGSALDKRLCKTLTQELGSSSRKAPRGFGRGAPTVKLPTKFKDKSLTIDCSFCQPSDAPPLTEWATQQQPKSTKQSAAIDYAAKIALWWRWYSQNGQAAGGLIEILERTKANPLGEVAICVLAKADWHPVGPIIGAALVRRTWANNLFFDYLAAHPAAIGEDPGLKTKGVGSALLYFVCRLGLEIRVQRLWGEATADSHTFYSAAFAVPGLDDLILANEDQLVKFVQSYEQIHGLPGLPFEAGGLKEQESK